ncbi:hypothetical protein ABK040_005633 [Willaertia magna]
MKRKQQPNKNKLNHKLFKNEKQQNKNEKKQNLKQQQVIGLNTFEQFEMAIKENSIYNNSQLEFTNSFENKLQNLPQEIIQLILSFLIYHLTHWRVSKMIEHEYNFLQSTLQHSLQKNTQTTLQQTLQNDNHNYKIDNNSFIKLLYGYFTQDPNRSIFRIFFYLSFDFPINRYSPYSSLQSCKEDWLYEINFINLKKFQLFEKQDNLNNKTNNNNELIEHFIKLFNQNNNFKSNLILNQLYKENYSTNKNNNNTKNRIITNKIINNSNNMQEQSSNSSEEESSEEEDYETQVKINENILKELKKEQLLKNLAITNILFSFISHQNRSQIFFTSYSNLNTFIYNILFNTATTATATSTSTTILGNNKKNNNNGIVKLCPSIQTLRWKLLRKLDKINFLNPIIQNYYMNMFLTVVDNNDNNDKNNDNELVCNGQRQQRKVDKLRKFCIFSVVHHILIKRLSIFCNNFISLSEIFPNLKRVTFYYQINDYNNNYSNNINKNNNKNELNDWLENQLNLLFNNFPNLNYLEIKPLSIINLFINKEEDLLFNNNINYNNNLISKSPMDLLSSIMKFNYLKELCIYFPFSIKTTITGVTSDNYEIYQFLQDVFTGTADWSKNLMKLKLSNFPIAQYLNNPNGNYNNNYNNNNNNKDYNKKEMKITGNFNSKLIYLDLSNCKLKRKAITLFQMFNEETNIKVLGLLMNGINNYYMDDIVKIINSIRLKSKLIIAIEDLNISVKSDCNTVDFSKLKNVNNSKLFFGGSFSLDAF